MECSRARVQISGMMDGALGPLEVREVKGHLESCGHCRSLYREQLAVSEWVERAVVELEPPAAIWERVEREIRAGAGEREGVGGSFVRRPLIERALHLAPFSGARGWGYVGAAVVLLLVLSVAVLNRAGMSRDEQMLLAELEAFSIDVSENPFWRETSRANPFLSLEETGDENPFDRPENTR